MVDYVLPEHATKAFAELDGQIFQVVTDRNFTLRIRSSVTFEIHLPCIVKENSS